MRRMPIFLLAAASLSWAQPAASPYTAEKRQVIGRSFAAEIEKSYVRFPSRPVEEYGAGLVRSLDPSVDQKEPWRVVVFHTEEALAFTLPGNRLYLSTGLLRNADSPATLARQVAHARAHDTVGPVILQGGHIDQPVPILMAINGIGACPLTHATPLLLVKRAQDLARQNEEKADALTEESYASWMAADWPASGLAELQALLPAQREPAVQRPRLQRPILRRSGDGVSPAADAAAEP